MTDSPREPEQKRSLFQLITELPFLLGELIRAELELLRRELLHRLKGTGIGLGLMVLALTLLGIFLTLLAVAGILALALVVPAWAAVLIVAGVVLVAALILAGAGAALLSGTKSPVPERTIDSVKQDIARVRGDRTSRPRGGRGN